MTIALVVFMVVCFIPWVIGHEVMVWLYGPQSRSADAAAAAAAAARVSPVGRVAQAHGHLRKWTEAQRRWVSHEKADWERSFSNAETLARARGITPPGRGSTFG